MADSRTGWTTDHGDGGRDGQSINGMADSRTVRTIDHGDGGRDGNRSRGWRTLYGERSRSELDGDVGLSDGDVDVEGPSLEPGSNFLLFFLVVDLRRGRDEMVTKLSCQGYLYAKPRASTLSNPSA